MKTVFLLCLLTALGAVPAGVQADVSIRFSTGDHWHHRRHARHAPAYYRHARHRPSRWVAVAPVVVPHPVYVPAPVAVPSAASPLLTGDQGTDLAELTGKLSRLRAVLLKQNEKGALSQDQYDRFMNALEAVEHDRHARAYDRGGNLTRHDFADLHRRLSRIDEDMEIALSE